LFALVVAVVGIVALLSYIQSFFLFPFLPVLFWSLAGTIVIAAVWYAVTHIQYAIGLPGYSFRQTLHFSAPKIQFYDKHLDNAVWYARHAMSIDENRADFARVPWGATANKGPPRPDSYPIGWTKSGLPVCIPTSAEVMLRTSRGCRTSRSGGWFTPQ
jgi:hypothetical protein